MRLLAIVFVLAACEPELDGTALSCDPAHGCPDDQSCFSGRCRRIAPISIGCGTETCMPDQQCCVDPQNGVRCIAAADVCPGISALCDGKTDCAEIERCCDSKDGTLCRLACESSSVACASDIDCPSDAIHCCPRSDAAWGRCSNTECP